MTDEASLAGKRIAVLAADGFEKVELSVPVKALQLAGAQVDIVSIREGYIRGLDLHEPAGRVRVDKIVQHASPAEYDALFIPGGFINPDLLRQSAEAREFVRAFEQFGKPIASMCHGPWLFASCQITAGRTLTSWPGIRDDLVNAGATWLDEEVVRDGNWITSRGPQDLDAFVPALIEFFANERIATQAQPRATESAPQRDQPPELAVTALKWMPRPSVRAAVGMAALGASVWAIARARNGQNNKQTNAR